MKLHLNDTEEINLVRAYDQRSVTVRDRRYSVSTIISPQRIITDWRPQVVSDLQAADWAELLGWEPEIVLLGTGSRLIFPVLESTAPVINRGIGLEVMDTSAACRTYNILAIEGRRVVAALLMTEG